MNTGKTTLRRSQEHRLPRTQFQSIDPNLTNLFQAERLFGMNSEVKLQNKNFREQTIVLKTRIFNLFEDNNSILKTLRPAL